MRFLSNFDRQAFAERTDPLALLKEQYEARGAARSNLRYGYLT